MKKLSKLLLCTATAALALSGCNTNKNPGGNFSNDNLSFEENYISRGFSYEEGGKFVLSLVSSLGNLAAGFAYDNPIVMVAGFFSLLTSLNDNLNGQSGPTIKDVMDKLNDMDKKLDRLEEKLDKNYTQLSTEIIRTQAKVEEVLLEQQDQAIKTFNTNYTEKIDDFQRDFSDYIEQSFKSYISQGETFEFDIKPEKDEWALVSLMEVAPSNIKNLKFEVTDFPKSKAFLQENFNVVTTGFMDKLSEDIDDKMGDIDLPKNLTKANVRNMAIANIVEKFTKKYYVENHNKALELRNLAINFAKQINGGSGKSIVDTYIERMKYMFNFAGEMKEYTYGALANLEHSLDVNTTLAAQACFFAEVNSDEIRTEFLNARAVITNRYKMVKEWSDNLSFLTNTNIGSGFYRAKYNVGYTNISNNPKFNAKFDFSKVTFSSGKPVFTEDNPFSHSYLTETDHLRIKTRMTLMAQNGFDVGESYIDYLNKINVIPAKVYNVFLNLKENQWLSDDALRFFTGLTIREMNDKDTSFSMQCVAKGNEDADYFNVGWKGTYKGGHDNSCWKGQIAETTFIDALTGNAIDGKRVCAYATYSESHWYWHDDEYWAFVDNPVGNYFFILENVA